MSIGKGVLAGGAILVGVLGLIWSGVASGSTRANAPYGMMSYFLGRGKGAAWGPWGMMGGSHPYYGMMGGYYPQSGSSAKGAPPYYGMMGGYFQGTGAPSQAGSGNVSQSAAARDATEVPTGATLDRGTNRITFHGQSVRFTAVAAPSGGPELSFEIAGLVDPEIVVPRGAKVTAQVINDDTAAPHDFVVSSALGGSLAFNGAASAMLGAAGSSDMPSSTVTFTASKAGSFIYECTVPGHAVNGMQGRFVVAR